MSRNANPARDVFAFSLGGMAAMNSYAFVPAIADDTLNRSWDRRLSSVSQDRIPLVWAIEDFLARYYAPGYREATGRAD